MKRKRAQLIADTVEVICPHCGEPQANDSDGSYRWMVMDFKRAEPKANCQNCAQPILISMDPKAQFTE